MLAYFLLLTSFFASVYGSPDEFRLLNDLRQNYDPIERPVANHNDTLTVQLRIILQQIVEVDAKNQMVTLVVWQKTKWEDYKMRWDPMEYGGLRSLQVPNSFLWRPDILLFNSADEKFDASFPVNFVVEHTGDVLLSPPGIVRLSCRIDITWFPYDEQICFMKFGSWSYDGDKVDLQIDSSGIESPHNIDLSYFIKNGEWELLSTPAVRVASEFDGLKYVEVYYKLHMKRRTLYYGLNWLVPSFLITLTGLLGFTLSPECGEKITLQITNLLSVTVFLGMVSAITPPTSESIPVIAIFFSISMVLLGASIVVTIWIVNIFYRSRKTHEMSELQRFIFLEWLPWFLMMSRPGSSFVKPTSECSASTSSTPLDSVIGTGRLSRRCLVSGDGGDKERLLSDEVAERLARHESRGSYGVSARLDRTFLMEGSDGGSSRSPAKLEILVKECLARLTAFQEKLEEDELDDDAQEDWRFMAKVIDRLSLYVFTILFILTSLFLFLATPRIFDYRPLINLTDEFNQTLPFFR
ncbi:hypothetical protein PMAYCL1PPCAC_17462 [Pristionchus mayeri]|uniref:Uncharacterized protein n=1 Tax=Pristionchus mayeri TaxID=1317129 RepID=A0AAN5CMQ4_9BILA|nr:hypothetical protein PMAYCL1PPCAC_17462 [Pristionchus mayeri]